MKLHFGDPREAGMSPERILLLPPPDLNQNQDIHERLYLGYDTPLRNDPG